MANDQIPIGIIAQVFYNVKGGDRPLDMEAQMFYNR